MGRPMTIVVVLLVIARLAMRMNNNNPTDKAVEGLAHWFDCEICDFGFNKTEENICDLKKERNCGAVDHPEPATYLAQAIADSEPDSPLYKALEGVGWVRAIEVMHEKIEGKEQFLAIVRCPCGESHKIAIEAKAKASFTAAYVPKEANKDEE